MFVSSRCRSVSSTCNLLVISLCLLFCSLSDYCNNNVKYVSAAATSTTESAFRATMTDGGVDKVKDIVVSLLVAKFQHTVLPDQTIPFSVPLFGTIDLYLTNILVQNLNIPQADVTVQPPDGLLIVNQGITLDLSLDYKWKQHSWPHAEGHGSITANPKSGEIDIGFSVTSHAGKPFITLNKNKIDFDNYDIKFHGEAAWLINIFVGLFNGIIRDLVNNTIQAIVNTAVTTGVNGIFANLPLDFPFF